jgi:hypothetical protein
MAAFKDTCVLEVALSGHFQKVDSDLVGSEIKFEGDEPALVSLIA